MKELLLALLAVPDKYPLGRSFPQEADAVGIFETLNGHAARHFMRVGCDGDRAWGRYRGVADRRQLIRRAAHRPARKHRSHSGGLAARN